MHRGHTWHDYPWPWMSFRWLLYNLQPDDVTGADFEIYCTLLANQKRKSITISNILMRITSKELYHEIYHSYITAVSRANNYDTRRGQTTPKCFVSSWVFHIISHYLKSIDSFYTKLGRWAGDLLPIIFTWKMSVNIKVVTLQWWRHVFCRFWSF